MSLLPIFPFKHGPGGGFTGCMVTEEPEHIWPFNGSTALQTTNSRFWIPAKYRWDSLPDPAPSAVVPGEVALPSGAPSAEDNTRC
mmetsp:Transcript_64575/g.108221  ORF Transcript_64575/g.108221 Transcript_64575/m.108221 type:complete len:85 (-) Transcript_64575:253-507(-)